MENKKDSNNQNSQILTNSKLNYWMVSTLLLLTILLITSLWFVLDWKSKNSIPSSQINESPTIPTQPTTQDKSETGMLELFISDYYSQYPKFQSEVKTDSIKRVFPLSLKKISENQERGWLVEVNKGPQVTSYYLLTPILQKELVDPKSCVSQDENPPIELEIVDTVGNERGLSRDLQEKSGYLILSGTKNSCYGGADSGFISVYNMRTGDKIKLQGDFTVPGTIWKGVSKSGNALGILRGIYGINEPTIVVEYGLFEGAINKVEEVGIVAFFDLQSGKLKQLVKFQ